MLVEVRVLLKGSLLRLLELIGNGLTKAFSLFRGTEREEIAVHYVGVMRTKEKGQAWLRYRVFVDSGVTARSNADKKATHILWVK